MILHILLLQPAVPLYEMCTRVAYSYLLSPIPDALFNKSIKQDRAQVIHRVVAAIDANVPLRIQKKF